MGLVVVIVVCLVMIIVMKIYTRGQERLEKEKNEHVENVLSAYRKKNESIIEKKEKD